MVRDEAVELIQFRLGNRRGIEEMVARELRASQERLEGNHPLAWFLETSASYATAAATQTVALPSDFLDASEKGIFITDADGDIAKLDRDDAGELTVVWGNEADALPQWFDIVGTNLYLYPTPDAVYNGTIWYFAQDTVLTNNVENNWLKYYSELMIAETGFSIAMTLRDNEAGKLFSGRLAEQKQNFVTDTVAREEAARQRRVRN